MLTSIEVTRGELARQRLPGAEDDVHFCESLVSAVIAEFSRPGELVLDPFAGFGTVLAVATRMGRRALGVELLAERAALARPRLAGAGEVAVGDARDLPALVTGAVDLCLTSPPYMSATGHPENPLTGYRSTDGHYPTYLDELARVFGHVARLLTPAGHVVVNVADQVGPAGRTPLVDDVAEAVSRHFRLERRVPVRWDEPPPGISGDTCLVFAAASA